MRQALARARMGECHRGVTPIPTHVLEVMGNGVSHQGVTGVSQGRRGCDSRDSFMPVGGKGHADNPRNAGGSWNAKPRRVKKKR